ncbi:MAG: GNAT family N-acetyltransferase [Burkholderiaceae bacterium]|nr:GNAT family N-acetyltransferase [Burkholderiaceae bacterium]
MVILQRMDASEFLAFFEAVSDSYARDNAASGRWRESDASSLAREETGRLLPQAEKTPDNELFVIRSTEHNASVGYVWYGSMVRGTKKVAFLFQLYIHPQYRRQGFGKQALAAFEEEARNTGHDALNLYVLQPTQAH